MINAWEPSHKRLGPLRTAPFSLSLPLLMVCWLTLAGFAAHADPLVSTESPIGFFTNVASRLLQSQLGLSLNHLQVYPTNQYTPSVHRLLQLTANVYDATTNRAGTGYPYLPSVFRPVFARQMGQGGDEVYICGFEEVTNTSVLSQPVVDLTDADARANLEPLDMVCGIPLVIGAKKGFPNFNEFAMQTQVQVVRKLQFHRPGTSTTMPVNEIDQMFVVGISNALGVEAWNSYSAAFPRDLLIIVQPDVSVLVTNLETGKWLNPAGARYQSLPIVTNIPAGIWVGFDAAFPRYSFQVPLYTNVVFLANSTYSKLADEFAPLTDAFERTPGTTNLYVPHWEVTLKIRLRFAVIDSGRIVDYVNLTADSPLDITAALMWGGQCGDPYYPDGSNGSMWCTNRLGGSTSPFVRTYGIVNQLEASMGHTTPDWNFSTHEFPPGMNIMDAIAFFKGQFQLGYLRSSNTFNAPFQLRNIYLLTSWQANDPLVHYLLNDLMDLIHTNVSVDVVSPKSTDNLGNLNYRYEPWGGGGYRSGSPVLYDPTVKDPRVLRSDDWDFPTNLLSDLTALGRVHRGTPWQTVYLKSFGGTNYPYWFANWQFWSGNSQLVTNVGQFPTNLLPLYIPHTLVGIGADASFTQPTNDWRLAGLLVSLLNTNDPRHLASVNQPDAAAWRGLLDGMTVLTNDPESGQFYPVTVSSNSPQAATVAAALDTARSSRLGGHFRDPADILATPELGLASPWLDKSHIALLSSSVNDEACEALPSQLLPLLRPDSSASVSRAGGALQLQFSGADAYAYVLQTSSNLLDWTSVSTNYPVNGSFNFVEPPPPYPPRRFYRSVLAP